MAGPPANTLHLSAALRIQPWPHAAPMASVSQRGGAVGYSRLSCLHGPGHPSQRELTGTTSTLRCVRWLPLPAGRQGFIGRTRTSKDDTRARACEKQQANTQASRGRNTSAVQWKNTQGPEPSPSFPAFSSCWTAARNPATKPPPQAPAAASWAPARTPSRTAAPTRRCRRGTARQ